MSSNGLGDRVAAVEAARRQLGYDVDRLSVEARAQIGQTLERTVWKLAAAAAGVAAGLAFRQALTLAWKATMKADPPANPASPNSSWGQSIAWTMATAAGMGLAKLIAIRGAAAGWQKALGTLPPGITEEEAA